MKRDKVDIRVTRNAENGEMITVYIFKDKAVIETFILDQLKNTSGDLFNLLNDLYIEYNVESIRFYLQ